jgi:hypothetical protein
MTQAIKHTIEELPTLRLPELQAYYAEVLGEPRAARTRNS